MKSEDQNIKSVCEVMKPRLCICSSRSEDKFDLWEERDNDSFKVLPYSENAKKVGFVLVEEIDNQDSGNGEKVEPEDRCSKLREETNG